MHYVKGLAAVKIKLLYAQKVDEKLKIGLYNLKEVKKIIVPAKKHRRRIIHNIQ